MADKTFTIRISPIPPLTSLDAYSVKVTSHMGRVLANKPFETREAVDKYADGWIVGFKATGDPYRVIDATE